MVIPLEMAVTGDIGVMSLDQRHDPVKPGILQPLIELVEGKEEELAVFFHSEGSLLGFFVLLFLALDGPAGTSSRLRASQ